MSATEWLSYIQTYIVISIVISILIAIPKLPINNKQRPLFAKKSFFIIWAFIFVGWGLAYLATHITATGWRGNMRDASKLMLAFFLWANAAICVIRLCQGNTLLWQLLVITKRIAYFIAPALSGVAYAMANGVVHSTTGSKTSSKRNNSTSTTDPLDNLIDDVAQNYRGEYCNSKDVNRY